MSESCFQKLNEKLLNAGKVTLSNKLNVVNPLETSKNTLDNIKTNPIVNAQLNSSIYDSQKLAADSLKKAKIEQIKTMGKGWYDFVPLQLDSKLKNDIKMIQMRNYIDPKRFYKNPDKMNNIIHTGTVIEGPSEYKSARLTNRERKTSIANEILNDKIIKDYSKRKFLEIQSLKSNKIKTFKKSFQDRKKAIKAKKIKKLF